MRSLLMPLCGALLPVTALAGGFESEYPDNNARVLGRGGAFVALADDPSAIQYNPAGLAKLHGVNLLLSVNLIDVNQTFRPAPDVVLGRSLRSFEPVDQEVALAAAPMLAVQFDFEALPDFDFAVGAYGPSGTTHRRFANQWTIDQVTNSSGQDVTDQVRGSQPNGLAPNGVLHEAEMLQVYPTLAVAWAAHRSLRVGISLQASLFEATIKKGIGGPAPGIITLEVSDWFTPTGILGVQYEPLDWLEIGAMYRPSFQNHAEGKGEFRTFHPCPNGPCPADRSSEPVGPYRLNGTVPFSTADGSPEDGVVFRFKNPDIFRLGARFIQPRFDVELNYLWQRNSVHDGFNIRFKAAKTTLPVVGTDGQDVEPVPRVLDPRHYEDTHGLRLGSDIKVLPDLLTIRAGASYETGASPDAYTNLDFPGLDQWSASLGATLHFGMVEADIGVAYVGFMSREVEDSKLGIIDITLPPENWKAVGNGEFSAYYLIGGLGARLKL